MDDEQHIQSYHNDRLSKEDRISFETKMNADPALAREAKEYKDLQAAIKESERAHLKSILHTLEEETAVTYSDEEETISFGKRYRHIYIAAALIIFAIIGFQFIQQGPSNQDLYASFYQPYPNTLQPVVRGEIAEDILTKAFVFYEAKDFEAATALFEQSLAQNYNADVSFYKAMSLLNSGKDREASQLLEVLKKEETIFKPQLYWYSALLALKQGDQAAATAQLDKLKALKSGYKDKAIEKIKKEIDR